MTPPPTDTPNRKEVFSERVGTFETHCKGMSETAADLAKAGGVMDKTAVEELMRSSAKVSYGTGTSLFTHILYTHSKSMYVSELYYVHM